MAQPAAPPSAGHRWNDSDDEDVLDPEYGGDDGVETDMNLEDTYNHETDGEKLDRANRCKEAGNEYLKKGMTEDAVRCYTEAIAISPGEPIFYSNRAAAHIRNNAWRTAVHDCKAALERDPTMAKALFRLAQCYLHMGQFTLAKDMIYSMSEAQQRDGDVLGLRNRIGQLEEQVRDIEALLREEKLDAASERIDALMPDLGSSTVITILRARTMLGLRKDETALKILNALYHLPDNAGNLDLVLWRGVAFYQTGSDGPAMKHFQEVLRNDPDNKTAIGMFKLLRNLESKKEAANALFKAGDAAKAVKAYSEALELDPKNDPYNATVFANRAAAEMKLENWANASRDCSSSIALKPDNAKVYVRRARCWTNMHQLADALRDLKKAESLAPRDEEISEELQKTKVLIKRSSAHSYYSVLGVAVTCSASEVKAAYRKLAMQWHPDKHTKDEASRKTAEERFKKITEAYEVLSDETKRRRYDAGAELDEINDGGQRRPSHSDFASMFGGFGGFGGGGSGFRRRG